MPEYDSVKVKDQLGRPEDVGFSIKRFTDTIIIEELSTVITKRDVSTDTIWGNFNWNESNWDDTYDNSPVTKFVVNPNRTYNEYFRDDYFKDATTTADWASTPGELSFTNGKIAQSKSIALNDGVINQATISMEFNSGSSGLITSELSADNGSNFESVTNNIVHNFTNSGTSLIFKLTSSGTAIITKIKINYL